MRKSSSKASAPPPHDDWQVQDDHRTLTRASEIMCDKKRFARAQEYGSKMAAGMEAMKAAQKGLRRY